MSAIIKEQEEVNAESRGETDKTKDFLLLRMEKRLHELEDSINELKSAIDRQNMVKEVARLNNLMQILKNIIMNELPPEGIGERRKCMHILESVMTTPIENASVP